MKRLNIILSVVLFTCTTVLITMLPIIVKLDFGQWLVLACFVILGYAGAYLYFDNYVDLVIREQRQEIAKTWKEGHNHGYDLGYYDGWKEGREDLRKEMSIDSINAIVDQDLIDLKQ